LAGTSLAGTWQAQWLSCIFPVLGGMSDSERVPGTVLTFDPDESPGDFQPRFFASQWMTRDHDLPKLWNRTTDFTDSGQKMEQVL